MFNSHQIQKIVSGESLPEMYQHDFDNSSKQFLKFLVEIVLQINSKSKTCNKNPNKLFRKKKNKNKSVSKSSQLVSKNKVVDSKNSSMLDSTIKNAPHITLNSLKSLHLNKNETILNTNIINNNQDEFVGRSPTIYNDRDSHLSNPLQAKSSHLFLGCHSDNLPVNNDKSHQLFFEKNSTDDLNNLETLKTNNILADFEQKFIEADLHKVITLPELQNLSQAIGEQDWGYIKHILTILSLMLESYQTIRESYNHDVGEASQNEADIKPHRNIASCQRFTPIKSSVDKIEEQNEPLKMNLKNEPLLILNHFEKLDQNKLIIPKQRTLFKMKSMSHATNNCSNGQMNNQLISLQSLFQKMKTSNLGLNESSCLDCKRKICFLHQAKRDIIKENEIDKKLY
jgi:hypothetical protein